MPASCGAAQVSRNRRSTEHVKSFRVDLSAVTKAAQLLGEPANNIYRVSSDSSARLIACGSHRLQVSMLQCARVTLHHP